MNSHHSQSLSARKVLPIIALSLFATLLGFAGSPAGSANALPSIIVTTDGRTYHAVKLQRVLPDGLLVQYQPDSGGMGLARLKFVNLSKSLQQQFGYDSKQASLYQEGEKNVMTKLTRTMREDENLSIGVLEQTTRSSVVVKVDKPLVKYSYYDPAGPKPPQITDEMDGVTQYAFGCNPTFSFQIAHSGAGEPFSFRIKTITIHLDLTIRIILPRGQPGKLTEHEEGHRKIVEYFYSLDRPPRRTPVGS